MDVQDRFEWDPVHILEHARGSSGSYCMGYLNPNPSPDAKGDCYISTLKLSVAYVTVENLDEVTEEIVTYDRCESDDAYIGQINMLTASSFCGLNGGIWGYDFAAAENLRRNKLFNQPLPGGGSIPVYNIYPLLDATQRLFGVASQRRFNPMPGAHVVCANKSMTKAGPCWVWSAIALAIAEDRSKSACLFIEDANVFHDGLDCFDKVKSKLDGTLNNLANSVVLCSNDQSVRYKEIFAGYKLLPVPSNKFVGCALTCAPYVLLPNKAVPATGKRLTELSIYEWEDALGLPPLPQRPRQKHGFLGPDGIAPEYGLSPRSVRAISANYT